MMADGFMKLISRFHMMTDVLSAFSLQTSEIVGKITPPYTKHFAPFSSYPFLSFQPLYCSQTYTVRGDYGEELNLQLWYK